MLKRLFIVRGEENKPRLLQANRWARRQTGSGERNGNEGKERESGTAWEPVPWEWVLAGSAGLGLGTSGAPRALGVTPSSPEGRAGSLAPSSGCQPALFRPRSGPWDEGRQPG